MRKTLGVCLLLLLLSGAARAGIMPNEAPAPPPPQPATAEQETTVNGEIQFPGVTEVALELLALLPSIL